MSDANFDIAKSYSTGELRGWAEVDNPGLAKEQFDLLGSSFVPFQIGGQTIATSGRKMFLWKINRQVLGSDTPNYPQQVGDCLTKTTQVLMWDGSQKAIEDVVVGDVVVTHLGNENEVIRTIKKPYSGRLVTVKSEGCDKSVTTTADHEFFNLSQVLGWGWTPAGCLSLEDEVLKYASDIKRIESLYSKDEDTTVYCLEVEEDHSFIANGYAVHNCVSFGAKNATEYLSLAQIATSGGSKFRPVFPPYYYGTGRVFVGRGRLGNGDGSLGSWMAEAVMKYGTLFSDEQGVPKYAGSVAKAWGAPNGKQHLDKWLPIADEFDVKSAALIRSWDELVAAICNGYACTTASNIGYDMEAGSDGFHRQRGSWAHMMSIVAVDSEYREPYACILNSWGDVHGRLKCFHDGHEYPVGIIRARRSDIEKHIRAGELFAYSNFVGFPERDLDKALFNLV